MRLHQGEFGSSNAVPRPFVQRHVDRDKIRRLEQGLPGNILDAQFTLPIFCQACYIVIDHLHLESPCTSGQTLSNTPHAENAEPVMVNIVTAEQVNFPLFPPAVPHETICLGNSSCRSHHQGKRKVGCRVGEYTRRIRDQDAPLCCRPDIYIVVANRNVCDHPELRAAVQDVCINGIC